MIAVVAGVLTQNGKYLITQRRPEQSQGLKWEFPGGKIEPLETPEAALERELFEELGIRTKTGAIIAAIHKTIGDRDLLLLYYHTEHLSGDIKPLDAKELRFAEKKELANVDFGAIDAEFAARFLSIEA